jgi:hypothetical protein
MKEGKLKRFIKLIYKLATRSNILEVRIRLAADTTTQSAGSQFFPNFFGKHLRLYFYALQKAISSSFSGLNLDRITRSITLLSVDCRSTSESVEDWCQSKQLHALLDLLHSTHQGTTANKPKAL